MFGSDYFVFRGFLVYPLKWVISGLGEPGITARITSFPGAGHRVGKDLAGLL